MLVVDDSPIDYKYFEDGDARSVDHEKFSHPRIHVLKQLARYNERSDYKVAFSGEYSEQYTVLIASNDYDKSVWNLKVVFAPTDVFGEDIEVVQHWLDRWFAASLQAPLWA